MCMPVHGKSTSMTCQSTKRANARGTCFAHSAGAHADRSAPSVPDAAHHMGEETRQRLALQEMQLAGKRETVGPQVQHHRATGPVK